MVAPSEIQLMIILLLLTTTPRIVHTADALRLLVVERFGGFYSDTDVVFLRFWNGDSSLIRRTVVMMLWYDNDCDSVKSAFAFCAGSANLTFPQECGQAKKCYS